MTEPMEPIVKNLFIGLRTANGMAVLSGLRGSRKKIETARCVHVSWDIVADGVKRIVKS